MRFRLKQKRNPILLDNIVFIKRIMPYNTLKFNLFASNLQIRSI